MNKRILWRGPATDPSGYGDATRNYLVGLAKRKDLTIKLKNEVFWRGDPCTTNWATLAGLAKNDFMATDEHVFIQHLTPDTYVVSPGNVRFHVGMTTFETDTVPDHWRMPMRAMDEIWTHSEWGRRIFAEQGIHRCEVVPHGVDTKTFQPGLDPLPEIKNFAKDRFVFGSNFDWTERKHPQGLLRGYYSAFKAEDPVVLVIKAYDQYRAEGRSFILAYINAIKSEMGLTKTPPIMLISQMLSQEQLARFYCSLDAYVLPSRGEGWGLTYSEAMASGLPTIGTNWGGNTHFMTAQNSVLLNDYKLTEISALEAGPQRQYIGHKWATVNHEEVGEKMKLVFNSVEARKQIGSLARLDMVTKHSWDQACATIATRLEEIYDMEMAA